MQDTTPEDGVCDFTGGGSVQLRPVACGNGYVEPDGVDGIPGTADDEECDDGNQTAGDGCSYNAFNNDFSCEVQGNYECAVDVEPDGTCDTSGSGSVVKLCGNNEIDPGEFCDDGNQVNADGCSTSCSFNL